MPPKRKRAGDEAADATTTTKKRATKATPTASSRKTRSAAAENNVVEIEAPVKATKPQKAAPPPPPVPKEPEYSEARVSKTFGQYADPDNQKQMSMEGLGRLLEDAGISVEGAGPLLLAWVCQAEEYGEITLEQWMRLKDLRVDTPFKLKKSLDAVSGAFYPNSSSSAPAPKKKGKNSETIVEVVNTTDTEQLALATRHKFKDFYMFCFGLMKKPEARVLPMEFATATWSVILQPKFPIVSRLLEFIGAHPSYKAVNKDLWTMTLEFCYAVQSKDLMTWNDDESWPSLLDEFVAWEKARGTPAPTVNGGDEDIEMA